MRFLVDQDVYHVMVEWLRKEGHDVASVEEDHPGVEDSEVCTCANREGRASTILRKDLMKDWRGGSSGI